jgi:hypothetical protein
VQDALFPEARREGEREAELSPHHGIEVAVL